MNYEAIIDEHMKTLELCRAHVSEFCQQAVEICNEMYLNKNHLYICGNGGSAADATHIVGELVGRLRQDRIPFPATCLGADFATMTAVSNDYGYDKIFEREVIAKVRPGDVLWCLSTSGNSANVINAVHEARKVADVKIIGMSGKSGGKLKELCDICLCVPNTFSDRIQEIHQVAYHLICQGIEEYLLTKDS
ncbi:D-sedoheptulose-7-phosphate isomerase [Candidatus Uabimicrobium amorphum]|uniref:Phosphoheptose isomerase n=1 Tax=Uabimicrobium amorphum TaxID=2596890 RepID=A0A5S9IUL6_UABAM|nr:SIS domain-containing protein [Candidatus Uabimicrobium amorphum]BBM87820.1 phosphoheptose isomerase [Candidatus Uabimicrobium amorphum]